MKLETKKPLAFPEPAGYPHSKYSNVACEMGEPHVGEVGTPPPIEYTHRVDDDLAVERAKHRVRTHEELAADKVSSPTAGSGLSFRMPMAGQCENDQFLYSTDAYGKPIR